MAVSQFRGIQISNATLTTAHLTAHAGITDDQLANGALFLKTTGGALTADLNANGHTITNLRLPTNLGDAVSLAYVTSVTETVNNALHVFGKHEIELNVNSALTVETSNNAAHAFGKHEAELNANNANTAETANNALHAYGKNEIRLNVNSAIFASSANVAALLTVANDTTSGATVFIPWVSASLGNLAFKTSSTKLSFVPSTGILSATGFSGAFTGNLTGTASAALVANNATYAFGKSEGELNVNSAAWTGASDLANNATYAFGKSEGELNVNSALFANTSDLANNSTYAFGKSEGSLNVNSALTANYATTSGSANNATHVFGYTEATFLKANGSVPLTANLSANGSTLTHLAWPVHANDAATMAYVDAHAGGGGGGYTGLVGAAFEKLDNLGAFFNGAQSVFTLTVSANTIAPAGPQNLLITLNGITQEPATAYTVDNATSTITFTTPPTADSLFFGTYIRQDPMGNYLSNVSVILPTNGQMLLFNGANNTWYNADVPTIGGGSGGTTTRVFGEVLADNPGVPESVFITLNTFVPLSTVIYLNGLRLYLGQDYEETDSQTITLTVPIGPASRLLIDYDLVTSTATRIYGELLADNLDGNANTFGTLNMISSATTTGVYRNGLRLCYGADKDYVVLDSNTILFSFTPVVSDRLLIDYDT